MTLYHKWFILLIGLKLKVNIWRLIKHDWTKFLPSELFAYAKQFYNKDQQSEKFRFASLKHQNRNDHHWEYWVPTVPKYYYLISDSEPLVIPEQPMKEMIADWLAASRTYEGKWPIRKNRWDWFTYQFPNIKIHPTTRKQISKIVEKLL